MTKFIVITHILAGIFSIISGLMAMLVKKGGKLHIKAGKVYFFGMTYVFISALVLSSIKFIPFLFMIAFLSYYGCYSGVKILKFKRNQKADINDKIAGYITLIMGMVYCFYALNLFAQKDETPLRWISLVFGILTVRAAVIGLTQFNLKTIFKAKKQTWLAYHLYAMGTSYIAATTAFVVTLGSSLGIDHWLLWIGPTIVGVPIINYWKKKVNPQSKGKAMGNVIQ